MENLNSPLNIRISYEKRKNYVSFVFSEGNFGNAFEPTKSDARSVISETCCMYESRMIFNTVLSISIDEMIRPAEPTARCL